MSRRAKLAIGVGLGLLALALGALLYLRSAHFRRYALALIVDQIENATGGRVELRGFRWEVGALEAELQGLVVRGRETDPARPLFAADDVFVHLKIISLLQRKIDWRLLRVTRPRIHVQVDAAGRSNVPEPKRKRTRETGMVERVLDLAIKRLEVIQGELDWNDRRLPLEFTAEKLVLNLSYEAAGDLYSGQLSFDTALPRNAGPQRAAARSLPSQVEAEIRLGRNRLEIARLSWKTQRSTVAASGQLSNFARLKIELNYDARLDVAEISAVSGLREMRSGQARLEGRLAYDTDGHTLDCSGNLRSEQVALGFPQFQLSGIYGGGKYRATREGVEVSPFRMFVLGGELAGSFRADDLGKRPKLTVTAQARGISIPALAGTFATPELPLTELRWAGTVEGDVRAQFLLSGHSGAGRDVRVESALTVRPPAVAPAGLAPVSGQAGVACELALGRAAPQGAALGNVALRNVSLATAASRISADGVIGIGWNAEQTHLQLVASSTSYTEWAPMVAALRPGKEPVPLELQGRAEFHGALRGALRSPRLEGRVEVRDFRYAGTPWNRFTGNLAYSAELLRLTEAELRRDGSSARLNFTAHLERGGFTDTSPFSLHAVAEKASLSDLQALAGTSYPLTGLVDLSVRLSGTWLNPQGSGLIQVTGGTLVGEAFDSLRANLNFAQREFRAEDIVLLKGTSRITGQAEYRPRDRSYRFQLTGDRLPLSEISRLRFPHVQLSGLAGFRASGAGTVERPSLDADAQIAELAVNGERVGNMSVSVETRETKLNARLQSQFLQGTVTGTMSAELTGDFPAQGRVEFTEVDLDALLEPAARGRVTAHSTSTGFLSIAGPLKKPEALVLATEIRNLRVAVEQVELRNQDPLRASWRNGVIQIEQAKLAGAQTDLRVAGSLRVTGPPAARTLNLRADGAMNMAFLRTLNPDLIGSGQVTLDAALGGTMGRPLLNGRAQIRNGGLALKDFPTGLSEVAGSVVFDSSRLQVEKLTAQAGGGNVRLSGFVDHGNGLPVFRLRAEAEGVRLRYPEGTSSLLNASLNLTGTAQRSLLSGDVVVSRASFHPRFDLAVALGVVHEPRRTPITSSLLHNLQLDVRVISSPDLRFEFSQARDLQVEAALRLRGTAARPAVLGRVDILQGEINFAGTQYVINRGDISFLNPFRIEPVLNLDLQTRVQQYEISIAFNGPMDKLNVTYRSEPPLPSSDIQALLITGRAREGVAGTQSPQSFPAIGTNTILSQALNAAVGSRIERIFGVGRLKIDPQVGGPETNPGARVTLEQQVTPDVKFTYITNLASTQQQVIQVEWVINRRWSVIAVRDRNGLFGIDLKWRKRFR